METLWCKNHENPSDRISHSWAPLTNGRPSVRRRTRRPCGIRLWAAGPARATLRRWRPFSPPFPRYRRDIGVRYLWVLIRITVIRMDKNFHCKADPDSDLTCLRRPVMLILGCTLYSILFCLATCTVGYPIESFGGAGEGLQKSEIQW